MKNRAKDILFVLSALPLLAKFPYMISVWNSSPLERMDFLMWLCIPFVAVISELIRRKAEISGGNETYKPLVFAAMLAAFALWVAIGGRINAAGVILGIFIFAAGTDLRFGRAIFVAQMPAFLFAILACPSLSYWLDYYLHIGLSDTYSYFAFKLAFATGFFILWCALSLKKRRYPRIWSIIFCMCVCAAALYNRIATSSFPTGDSLFMNTQANVSGNWIARDDHISEADKKFFAGCDEIIRKTYFSDDGQIHLLALKVNRISSIHPVGICLESAGFEIKNSRQIFVPVGEKNVQINELEVEKNGRRTAVYSWFSDGAKSTGDFTKFRLQKSSSPDWRHYQIMTPILKTPRDSAKKAREFINAFKETDS